jgi:hypothetical protein
MSVGMSSPVRSPVHDRATGVKSRHARALSPLERTGRFVILRFVDGAAADEQFVDLPQPVFIEE